MDRLTEKLKKAGGVAVRVSASIEAEADKLIARETEIEERKATAFAPHYAVMDQRHRSLDQLEDALKIMGNADPLDASGDSQEVAEEPASTFQG